MLRTLQYYVSRELIKTFALAATGLTLVFSLCGGVLNMIQSDVMTVFQVARIFGFVIPLALTLTLPVAALFSCAMVYGRFAADNEFDACRASGVNIHRLLAPAMGLSIFTCLFTFAFSNYILPTFVEKLEALVRKDIEQIVVHKLQSTGFIHKGPYILYARDANLFDEKADRKIVQIEHGAFFELEGENLRGAGTAQQARIDFIKPPQGGNPTVEASLFDVRRLDLKRNQFHEEKAQPFTGLEVPNTFREKPKFLNLNQLISYRKDLSKMPTIREHTDAVRQLIKEAGAYRWAVSQLKSGEKTLQLQTPDKQYTIRAAEAKTNYEDMRPELKNMHVIVKTADGQREYRAEGGSLKLKNLSAKSGPALQVMLRGKVTLVDTRDPNNVVPQRDVALEEMPLPPAALAETASISDDQILGMPDDLKARADLSRFYKTEPDRIGLGERIEEARQRTRRDLVETGLDITGIIHSRLAFSTSVLVMLVLASALAIIYRGGQLLTAFVISFIPGLLVVVMNLAGRQLAERYQTHMPGLAIIWAAIAIVALADVIVLTKFLKR